MTHMTTNFLSENASKYSLSLVPFMASDLFQIKPQEGQKNEVFSKEFAVAVEIEGLSYTFVNGDNEIVSVMGVLPMEDNMGASWCLNSDKFKDHYFEISKITKRFIDNLGGRGFKKLFGSVTHDFERGHKWMSFLKFHKSKEQNKDFVLYEREF